MHVVEEVVAVPPAEENHLSAADKIGRVVEASHGGTTALGTLVPSHGDGVKRVQVSKASILGALATEHDDPSTCKHGRVTVASGWGRAADFGLEPSGAIYVEHMSVVQISESTRLAFVEVTTEDNQ